MRIGFIDKMAEQTMVSKGVSRNAALTRHAILWAGLGGICLLVWAFVDVEGLMFQRRSSEVPVEFLLWACGAMFIALGGLFLICRERE